MGPLVSKIKVGILKQVAVVKKAPRPLWTAENVLRFVTALAVPERFFFGLENYGAAIVMLPF